jgi:hypothetical protein
MLMDSDSFRSVKKKKVIGIIEVMSARGFSYPDGEGDMSVRYVTFEKKVDVLICGVVSAPWTHRTFS